MSKKSLSKKEVMIREILKIYRVIYDYNNDDLVYCYYELKYHKNFKDILYINHKLKEINSFKIDELNLFKNRYHHD